VAFLKAFGAYLPSRVVTNEELAPQLNCSTEWIVDMSGIEERRYATPEETVAEMAVAAAKQCMDRAGMSAADIGLLIVSSGSAERRFPGPATTVAHQLGLANIPAIDLPMASAGSLFAMALAQSLAEVHGNVLVVAAEKMSAVASRPPMEPGIAILFGDGAGACIIAPGDGPAKIVDAVLHTDGAFAEDLRLEFEAPLTMNGRSVIMQASRKIPGAISEVLQKHSNSIRTFAATETRRPLPC
jgi:3-oxoacyl-[acyl-carrier-protein] synthase III